MLYLLIGVLLFGGPHFACMLWPNQKMTLVEKWGRGKYMGLYSLASFAGIIFLALGYLNARAGGAAGEQLYAALPLSRHLMMTIVLIGFILIFSNGSKGYIAKYVRHPFSIGIALWSGAHLMLHGEVFAIVIFGMFLAMSLLDILLSTMRHKKREFTPHWKQDMRGLVVGIVMYLVFALGFHPYVLGIPVVS